MFQKIGLLICLLAPLWMWSQQDASNRITKKLKPESDTLQLENTSISPQNFRILDRQSQLVDTTLYKVDFSKSRVIFRPDATRLLDTIVVEYQRLPDFLTKTYSLYDPSRVVSNEAAARYQVKPPTRKPFVPFDGLQTSGSITRGITVGNNQNAVTQSSLDLQIVGKLSDKVNLRASIQDANVPLQEGGYSQKLDEFDQIFIELFSDDWSIRAGDLFLENRKSRFLNFSKKVQGISAQMRFGEDGNRTSTQLAVGLVRGQYARSQFIGQEGNQGPYKLRGQNGELYVLVISGSERVYVNGILLERGEDRDYVIDYNAGEISFTPLFPITSEMRITIEYQYSERNYTRFVTYGGVLHERKKWSLGTYFYSENDVKNQPLQQNLTPEQAQILVEAGDDVNAMVAPSAYQDVYSENKILYRKVLINGEEVYEYSNDPAQTLYNVRFTLVGANQGNYILANTAAVGKIYQYVAAVGGIPQGSYEPVIRLVPPVKLQLATLLGTIQPTEKTWVEFEGALSNSDQNLFSPVNDGNNQGLAAKVQARQHLIKKDSLEMVWHGQLHYIDKDFRTIERLFQIEFERDWNLSNLNLTDKTNQLYATTGVTFSKNQFGKATYGFEFLNYGELFDAHRHVLQSQLKHKSWSWSQDGSIMQSRSNLSNSDFVRNQMQVRYQKNKNWFGASHRLEDNQEKVQATRQFSALSQRFQEFGGFVGRGDSTKVYLELGYLHRINDSVQNGWLTRVNKSHSYYLKSRLVKSETADLSVYVNYRRLVFEASDRATEPSLNSRITYSDRYFGQLLSLNAAYENTSGTLPRQEFTYIEVEPGLGVYTWNDYNLNGIQELEEFEVAPFQDLAKYIRVFLPNQVYLKTHQNRLSVAGTMNFGQWINESGLKKVLSYFYNQTSFISERKIQRVGDNFDLDPFSEKEEGLLGLNRSFRNSLFYNRGKQNHSITYTYLDNRIRSLLSVGTIENGTRSHQLQYTHLWAKTWLTYFETKTIGSTAFSENYTSRNYDLQGYQFMPKISYLFHKNASWDFFFEHQLKENSLGAHERLSQSRLGTSFSYTGNAKFSANGEFSFYNNAFTGDVNSAVGYQMLEGLQAGKNTTWRLLLQKNITQYLDINVNYQGRKSETSKAVHTGNIQLRAFF